MKTLFLIPLLTFHSTLLCCGEDKLKPLHSYDIGLRVEIIGDLGIPLWMPTKIVGVVYEEGKTRKGGGGLFVRVKSVDGKAVKRKIVIPLWTKEAIPHDTVLHVEVIEKGRLEYAVTPNRSTEDDESGSQVLYTGVVIIFWKKPVK